MAGSHSYWADVSARLANPASSIAYGIAASALFAMFHGLWGKASQRRREGRRSSLQAKLDRTEELKGNGQFTTWMTVHYTFKMVRSAGLLILFLFIDQIWVVDFPKTVGQIAHMITTSLSGWCIAEFIFGAISGAEFHEIFMTPNYRIERLKKKLSKFPATTKFE